MNISIPHKWLLEHLATKATPKTIAENLSLAGPSVESIDDIQGDQVYDIETTTNRVDATSIRGIAREAAAVLPEFDINATLKPLKLDQIQKQATSKKLPTLDLDIQNDPQLCHRILAIKLSDVQLGDSPQWLQDRLIQVGQRPLNNVIDITNYIMWDMGHPIHAFDYDKLVQKKIIVRQAKKGEKFTTLDNQTYTCSGGEVIFDDGNGTIVDLPGIMGTANTVVGDDTKNVLLWIESVDSVKIRQASMTHSIRSQAAVLNEKNVDPHLGLPTMLKAITIYHDVTSAQLGSQLIDIFPNSQTPQPVKLKQTDLNRYLGIDISPSKVTRILKNLEFQVEHNQKQDIYHVTPPTFRQKDIQIYQDIIEEIARIYGYHNLPSTLMDTPIPDHPDPTPFHIENTIKSWLVGWGAQEIYTYSMVSEQQALDSGIKLSQHIQIKNPLTDDWVYMRTSLIPSLISVLESNPTGTHTLFELQNIYPKATKPSDLPLEQLQLSVITNQSYAHLKGILDALLDKLYISKLSIKPQDYNQQALDPNHTAAIYSDKQLLGYIGKTNTKDYYALSLNLPQLLKAANTHPTTMHLNHYPPIIEDLTFTLPLKTHVGPIIDTITTSSNLIQQVSLKTIYQQNYTFTIHYRHSERPLTDKEIDPLRKKIVKTLQKSHQAKLVGSLD